MKTYTIEDFEDFEIDEYGIKICPSGDYSQIKHFDIKCSFNERCSFSNGCSFTERCHFDENCSFGATCSFEMSCSFAAECSFGEDCYFYADCDFKMWCRFGEDCRFAENCRFGKGCSFGMYCSFCENCSFDEGCRFGEMCTLENNLKFENIREQVDRVIKIDRIGSRRDCTYFFKTSSNIYVSCGCFFGTIAKFEAKVNETHKYNEQYKKEYLEAIKYIKAVM